MLYFSVIMILLLIKKDEATLEKSASSLHHHLHKQMTTIMIIDYSIDIKHYYEKILNFKDTFYYFIIMSVPSVTLFILFKDTVAMSGALSPLI